ncbi:hypothetical protein [Nannocystis bainbridge]|uniref:Uncharacterized protein n=1 Tax=Nannocystis bainbridge TaxID=2995303 RepID=A0ABT5E0X3_9BACT|nr:hypothetical protein [Nannocystis bainbridge]MDC0719060.1 hypothetical protein [Nannocystis bainbridge]
MAAFRSTLGVGAWCILHVTGCSLRPLEPGETATEATTSTGTTTPGTGTTGTSAAATTGPDGPTTGVVSETSTGVATVSGTDDSGTFVIQFDMGEDECDPWERICPEGQKCMPFADDGGSAWNRWGCFPLVPDPAGLDEPCTVIDSAVSGKDTCDDGLQCWDVDEDTGMGTCLAMCTGTPNEPMCPIPNTDCTVTAGDTLVLCLPSCDPLAQDCPDGDLCLPNPQNPDRFLCVLDASGEEGQVFDACEFQNACDPGLVCAPVELATECDPQAPGCCLPFCDVSTANTCPGQGQECLAWSEMGQAPPGLENVGFCGIPSP